MDHLSIFTLACCGFTTLHSKGAGPLQDELLCFILLALHFSDATLERIIF
jgi:hypothetical protein